MSDEFLKSVAAKIDTAVGARLTSGKFLPLSQREETLVTEATNAAVLALLGILADDGLLDAPSPPGVN